MNKMYQNLSKDKNLKPAVFAFHYNKPLSKQKGKPQITIHYKQQCIIVDNLKCFAPVRGHINKRQPYFVMKGETAVINIVNGIATIY